MLRKKFIEKMKKKKTFMTQSVNQIVSFTIRVTKLSSTLLTEVKILTPSREFIYRFADK